MYFSPRTRPRVARPVVWLGLLLFALISCGGGQDTAGVGTGGTGLKEGNVSGFGSVYIDGVRYDNSQAVVQVNDGLGGLVDGQLKLGQRVRAVVNDAGQVTTAEILPALVGTVGQAPNAQGYLMVMGQWVRFVSKALPYQSTLSSSTFLGGYSSLADVAVADAIEVHGSWVDADPLKGRVLVASRIEKLATRPTRMLLTGTVLEVGGRDFTVQAADGRKVMVRNASAPGTAVGDWVKVWVDAARVPDWDSDSALQATHVSAASLSASQSQPGASVEISGLPTQFDPVANTVTIQGMTVRLQTATLSPATQAALASHTFTRFTLRPDAQSGAWTVQLITLREGDSLGGVTAVVARGDASTMLGAGGVVRLNGVDVEIGDTLLQGSSCVSIDQRSPYTVSVTGSPVGDVVQANTLECNVLRPP